jgi:hypothetical protein
MPAPRKTSTKFEIEAQASAGSVTQFSSAVPEFRIRDGAAVGNRTVMKTICNCNVFVLFQNLRRVIPRPQPPSGPGNTPQVNQ